MNGFDLLNKMELIDATYVEQADKKPQKKKRNFAIWGLPAACLVLVVALSVLVSRGTADPSGNLSDAAPTKQQTQNDADTQAPTSDEDLQIAFDSLLFNDSDSQADVSANRLHLPGYFTEELNEQELDAVLPHRDSFDRVVHATAGFNGDGTPIAVFLEIQTQSSNAPVRVSFFSLTASDAFYTSEDVQVSTVNGMDFVLTHGKTQEDHHELCACAEINGWMMQICYDAEKTAEDKAKRDFASVLADFADYEDGKPDFSAIAAEEIPEYYDKQLHLQEAAGDAQFGAFMLQNVPDGFVEESVRRYKDQNHDYLSGLWTKGLAELRWKIEYYSDADAGRLTGIDRTENYDLSLYPIPRADSVPEEKREIVDNPIFKAEELTLETVYKRAYTIDEPGDIEGQRMAFSVLYGNIVVEIHAKGVDPVWIYEQLQTFIPA